MRLDYQPKSGLFTLHVPRAEANLQELMQDHGLDHSLAASTSTDLCLFTSEPYAAAAFGEFATPSCLAELDGILREIKLSWAPAPFSNSWPDYLKPDGLDPYPLQLANLEYALNRKHTLIGDDMGVGKTPTAIMYANLLAHREQHDPRNFRGLAIVPASIRLQWRDRIRTWSTILNVQTSALTTSQRGIPPNNAGIHWTIMSYDTASNPSIYKAILANHYDLLVLDEAHYLKSSVAARTRSILGAADRGSAITRRAEHVLALTGTPIPNRPREAYGLAHALCHEAIDFMSERAFNERFNPRAPRRADSGRVAGTREAQGRYYELQARMRANYMTRHLYRDAFPQLRLPLFDLVYADDTVPVRQALEAERLLDIDPETFTGADGKVDGAVSTARKMMGVALAPQVARYVQMLHDGGADKIVLFGWHIEAMDILQKALDKLGVVRVDGRTTETAKAKAVIAFQTDPRVGVILGNVLSLGTGTDGLQHVSRHVVVAEPDWVTGNNVQMVSRLDRSGQTGQVQADFFVARDSLAERVLAVAIRKGAVINKTLDKRLAA